MENAIRSRGMKFITTFHHAFNFQHHSHAVNGKSTGYYTSVPGWPTASNDPELRLLYGNLTAEEFYNLWKGKLFEVIDNYQPDIIWFDFVLGDIPEQYRMEFLAYYFNKAREWNKEVVVTYKGDDLPKEVGVEDFEKGRLDHLTDYPWLTDDTISWGSWCYTQDLQIKTFKTVLHTLIDIVSKNGVLLLNISPMSDGTIPENQKQVLLDIGEWLEVNGEAIYSTRPWKVYGQGPTKMNKSGHFVGRIDYTGEDIRFTSSKDKKVLYAISLGSPENTITIEGVRVSNIENDAQISLLGSDKKIEFEITDKKMLKIIPSLPISGQDACVFKITGFRFNEI
jgi:alpha-L-fucosidase